MEEYTREDSKLKLCYAIYAARQARVGDLWILKYAVDHVLGERGQL